LPTRALCHGRRPHGSSSARRLPQILGALDQLDQLVDQRLAVMATVDDQRRPSVIF
jgi:hypothetical protein